MSFLNAPPTGLRGLGGLQRLGRSLMLPIAALPAAGLLLRLGQDDLLGSIGWLSDVAAVFAGAGGAIFDNLPLIFAVGIAIGWAKKADGSTALAAVVGYVVLQGVFEAMSPIILGEAAEGEEQELINFGVLGASSPGSSPRCCGSASTGSSSPPTWPSSAVGGSSRSSPR